LHLKLWLAIYPDCNIIVSISMMKKIVANFASILLFAIIPFVLGPQSGSLDIDGDGVPDVPFMLIHGGINHIRASHVPSIVGLATPSFLVGLMCSDRGTKRRSIVNRCSSRLDSSTPLRC
jgi:hypothetical protein